MNCKNPFLSYNEIIDQFRELKRLDNLRNNIIDLDLTQV